MKLVKFKDFLGKKGDGKSPPSVIRAKDLDDNFGMLQLIPDKMGIYEVDVTPSGSSLNFLAAKRVVTWREILVCVEGVEKRMMVLGTEPY